MCTVQLIKFIFQHFSILLVFIPACFKLMFTYGFYFLLFQNWFWPFSLFSLITVGDSCADVWPHVLPAFSSSHSSWQSVGRADGPESLWREWPNAWFIHVESVTGSWPFYLLNILNLPTHPLHPCVRTGHHHSSPGSLLSLFMASCLLSPPFQFTLHPAAQWYF